MAFSDGTNLKNVARAPAGVTDDAAMPDNIVYDPGAPTQTVQPPAIPSLLSPTRFFYPKCDSQEADLAAKLGTIAPANRLTSRRNITSQR